MIADAVRDMSADSGNSRTLMDQPDVTARRVMARVGGEYPGHGPFALVVAGVGCEPT